MTVSTHFNCGPAHRFVTDRNLIITLILLLAFYVAKLLPRSIPMYSLTMVIVPISQRYETENLLHL